MMYCNSQDPHGPTCIGVWCRLFRQHQAAILSLPRVFATVDPSDQFLTTQTAKQEHADAAISTT